MALIKDLIEKNELPKSLPHTCECGGELETNEALTEVWCSNPFCFVHNANKMVKMFEILGIKSNIGESRATEITNSLKLIHPMQLFHEELIDALLLLGDKPYLDLSVKLREFVKHPIKLSTFIDAIQMETIGTTRANLIFNDFKSPQEFYEKLHKTDKLEFKKYIANCIKVSYSSSTVKAIYDELIAAEKFIMLLAESFEFQETMDETLYISITGPVTRLVDDDGKPFSPREKLGQYLTEKFNINVIPSNISKRHVSYLVMDTNMTGNSKYNKAVRDKIPVVTSEELYNILSTKEE